jgi:hypothetical protein
LFVNLIILISGGIMKKGFVVLTAVFVVLAMTGYAFATNTATINVTSEPIRQYATCDKAGGFTVTWDKTTVLMHGDQITADLDLNVTLCRTVDIVIAAAAGADLENQLDQENVGWDIATTPNTGAPFTLNDGGVANNFASNNGGVYFWIHGIMGGARITIDVIGENANALVAAPGVDLGSFTVGPDDEDKASLRFLDQQTNVEYATDGVWVDRVTAGVYADAAVQADNTLCINVSALAATITTVDANCDSKADKFTFIPSDPQVAHIVAASQFSLIDCKSACGTIAIGSRTGIQGATVATCTSFDNETRVGYCAGTHANRDVIVYNQSGAYEATNYQVYLQIFKNGAQTVNQGVYWTNEVVMADGFATSPCGTAVGVMAGVGPYSYSNWDGSVGGTSAPNVATCDVATGARAVNVLTDAATLSLDTNSRYLKIDIPAMNYDIDEIVAGDTVTVRLTLMKAPCGTLFTGDICMGTFGCATAAATFNLTFPYFTQMTPATGVDAYWDGIAIVNMTGTAGSATLTVFEADGDQATGTVAVGARSMYVNLLELMLSGGNLTAAATNTGTLGDARCYITVTTNFSCAGFGMMGRSDTGESMGYLPFPHP